MPTIPPHYAHVFEALAGVKPQGASWVCLCPAHEDGRQSCRVKVGHSGALCFFCLAGCQQTAIVGALKAKGIKPETLFPPKDLPPSRIVARYSYTDEFGELLYQKVRFEPKDFAFRRQVDGKWVNGLDGCRRVLYNQEGLYLCPGRCVWFPEGEKDADALGSLGLLATSTDSGARSEWRAEWTPWLAERLVILMPDPDEAGRRRIETVGMELTGKAKLVVLDLVDADAHKWIEREGDGAKRKLLRLSLEAPSFERWMADRILAKYPESIQRELRA